MKKLEALFAKADKFGRVVANRFNKIKDLNDIRGTGQGKTVLITGASSGLGAAMARKFAFLGYDLAIWARRLDRLESLKAELEKEFGIKVAVKTLDVTVYDDVPTVFEAFASELGGKSASENMSQNAMFARRRLERPNFARTFSTGTPSTSRKSLAPMWTGKGT